MQRDAGRYAYLRQRQIFSAGMIPTFLITDSADLKPIDANHIHRGVAARPN
jgi:hypothetical protein